MSTSWLY